MKYIKYIIILLALIPTYGYAAPSSTYLTNSVFVATTTAGCLEFSALGEIFSKGVGCGVGAGGSGGGTWSTTTSTVSGQLINYPNNTTDIPTIGSSSTTTAKFFFDPNTNRFIVKSGNIGIGTTTPYAPLSVVGQIVGSYFTATSTSLINIFPLANITRLTNLTSNGFIKTSGSNGTLSVDTTTYESGLTAGDGLTRTSNDFDCDTANGSTFGCLSSTDWTTFNNKVGISSNETAGNLSYWTSTNGTPATLGSVATTTVSCSGDASCTPFTVIGSSPITISSAGGSGGGGVGWATTTLNPESIYFYGTSNVGIGTTSPLSKLSILSTTEQLRLSYDQSNYVSFTVDSSGDVNTSVTGGDEFDFYRGLTGGAYVDIGQNGTGDKQLRIFNSTSPNIKLSSTGDSYLNVLSGEVGIGTTSPWAKLSVEGESTLGNTAIAGYFVATTTATSTFAGGIQTNLLNIRSTTASSTFANGINLTSGCYAVNGVCITGGGGGGVSGPVTTTLEFNDIEPQTDSNGFAPGGSYIQPIYGPTFTNGTSSRIYYRIPIPQNISATPNASLIPYITATGTPSTGRAALDFAATTTGAGQDWYTTRFTTVHAASTTAANLFSLTTGTSLPITSTSTISLSGITLTAGNVLIVEVTRYGEDADDTVDNDVFMPKLFLKLDVN